MSVGRFFLGFIIVVLLSYAKSQVTEYWVPVEFSFFLIFLIVRSSEVPRALVMTFVLSMSLDLIFQTSQTKGLSAMGQLMMVFFVIHARHHVIPNFCDLFLTAAFAIFYLGNYYIDSWLAGALGVYARSYPPMTVLFFTAFHTVIFGLILVVLARLQRGK